jgi:prepilin peptidase CpaA
MTSIQTIWAFTFALTALAALLDLRTRRIPNWLTVPAFCGGVALHTWISGWRGTIHSLEGAGLALAILLPLVLLRALGAGDWKLMGAVGALVGPLMFLFVLLASVLVSGVMAIVLMVHAKRAKATMKNLAVLVRGFLSFGLRRHPEISLDNPSLLKLPFGVAAALGTIICYCCYLTWGRVA